MASARNLSLNNVNLDNVPSNNRYGLISDVCPFAFLVGHRSDWSITSLNESVKIDIQGEVVLVLLWLLWWVAHILCLECFISLLVQIPLRFLQLPMPFRLE